MATVWTKQEAAPIVADMDAAVRPYGWAAEMVGSVADYGSSEKDLDIVVYPPRTKRTSMTEVVAVVNAIKAACPALKCTNLIDDIIVFVDARQRPIEIWLGNVPEEIWQSYEYRCGISVAMIEAKRGWRDRAAEEARLSKRGSNGANHTVSAEG